MKENREENKEEKLEEKRFKLNKLIIYVYSNSFYLFLYYIRTKKFKNM